MLIKKFPDGKVLLGVTSDNQTTNDYTDHTPIGTVQMYKADNSATSQAYALVTVPTGTSYTSQIVSTPSGFKDKGDQSTVKCEVYTDQITVKFRLIAQSMDTTTSVISEIIMGYIFPVGSTANLAGFEKVATINVKSEFRSSGGVLLNIISTTGPRITGFYINSGFSLDTNYNAGYTLSPSNNILVEFDTVSNDLIDTISDLSSESAAKFVSR